MIYSYLGCTKRMQTGLGTFTGLPTDSRSPNSGSIAKTKISLVLWFAASRYRPVGSIVKLRGVFPPVDTWPRARSVPVWGLTENMAILSCPLFDPYTKFPEG